MSSAARSDAFIQCHGAGGNCRERVNAVFVDILKARSERPAYADYGDAKSLGALSDTHGGFVIDSRVVHAALAGDD